MQSNRFRDLDVCTIGYLCWDPEKIRIFENFPILPDVFRSDPSPKYLWFRINIKMIKENDRKGIIERKYKMYSSEKRKLI